MVELYERGRFRTLSRAVLGLLLVAAFFIFVLWRTENPRLLGLRLAMFDAVAPALEAVAGPSNAVAGLFDDVRSLAEIQAENARLRDQVERLASWREAARRLEEENARLRALNAVKLPPRVAFVTAEVIGDSGGPYAQSVLINAGRDDGVSDGATALDGGGLVGRVAGVAETSSRVLLITDPASRVPVTVGPDRVRAIMVGDESDQPVLLYAAGSRRDGEIELSPGERVATSGQGGVFPRGLLIGAVAPEDDGPVARVALAAEMRRLVFLRVLREARRDETPGAPGLIRPLQPPAPGGAQGAGDAG